MNISRPNTMLGNLISSSARGATTPKLLEGFEVKVGAKSSPEGIPGGTLSQADYDTFKAIADKINVNNATGSEMRAMMRGLRDAGLVQDENTLGFLHGPSEYSAGGAEINADVKYNQLEYQKQVLPNYAAPDFAQTRGIARDAFKVITAVANASSQTGTTVSSRIYAQQDIDRANQQALKTDLSALGKTPSSEETKTNNTSEIDIVALLMQLEAARQAKDADAPGSEQAKPASQS